MSRTEHHKSMYMQPESSERRGKMELTRRGRLARTAAGTAIALTGLSLAAPTLHNVAYEAGVRITQSHGYSPEDLESFPTREVVIPENAGAIAAIDSVEDGLLVGDRYELGTYLQDKYADNKGNIRAGTAIEVPVLPGAQLVEELGQNGQ